MSAEEKNLVVDDPTKSISALLKNADSDEAPVLLRSEKFLDPRKAPTLEAMTKHIREYKRVDLKQLMPSEYWEKVVHLGPPDVKGDPVEQAGNAGCVYYWVNFVRTIVLGELHPHAKQLQDAERAERVNIDRFSEMAAASAKKIKVKDTC